MLRTVSSMAAVTNHYKCSGLRQSVFITFRLWRSEPNVGRQGRLEAPGENHLLASEGRPRSSVPAPHRSHPCLAVTSPPLTLTFLPPSYEDPAIQSGHPGSPLTSKSVTESPL